MSHHGSIRHRTSLAPKAAWALPVLVAGLALCLLPMLSGHAVAPAISDPGPLAIKEYLGHAWTDELVHFDLKWANRPSEISLVDSTGRPVAFQLTDVERDGAKRLVSARLWTVVSLKPRGSVQFQVVPRQAASPPAPEVSLEKERGSLVLRNGKISLRLPELPGKLTAPRSLTDLPAPLLAVQRSKSGAGGWLGGGQWSNNGPAPEVRDATTTVLASGPVLAIVRQQYLFTDGSRYTMELRLGARQDAAAVTEDSTLARSNAAFRFSMRPGLNADSVFWQNQATPSPGARAYQRLATRVAAAREAVVCRLRPWSFWWLKDISQWAGFYRQGSEDFLGVVLLRPSRWSPAGWDGFTRTEIPVTSSTDQGLDLTMVLASQASGGRPANTPPAPLHREWAVTVGTVAENVPGNEKQIPNLRRQLTRYSEFPLDDVKEYGFDFPARPRPANQRYLLFGEADLQRVRRQAQDVESVRSVVEEAKTYIARSGGVERTLSSEGAQSFYTKHYIGNYLIEKLPTAYLGSSDPLYGRLLAATVRGLTQEIRDDLLEQPDRSSLGTLGPWFSESVTRLLFAYQLVAGTQHLDPEADAEARSMLVFAAHFLAHPDYWNPERGLSSANPNMTSSIFLPRALLALALNGHPEADDWLVSGEGELKRELREWVSLGGAWVESPGYQASSLDGMFLLAQALRNVAGRDYFADMQFRATMDYYGFLLSPPDPRFPPNKGARSATSTLPSIGDTFSGHVTGFNGWMAAATARTDPEYSRRQQFYWKAQGFTLGNAGRAKGFLLALTDPALPAAPPTDVARGFPGFGSVLRTSWTDPKATYLVHRTGPSLHHYHDDYNSLVLYAKGAPLCTDFGNLYQPLRRDEAWYHNRVSWDKGDAPKRIGSTGKLIEFRSLPESADYSLGQSTGTSGQSNERSILLVKSPKADGDSYALVRDRTGGNGNQPFYWNLWCLADDLQVDGRSVARTRGAAGGSVSLPNRGSQSGEEPYTFTGQFGVNLDVHVLSPSTVQAETDRWNWKQQIYVWGAFEEEQQLLRLRKQGPSDDFFTILYPRAAADSSATVIEVAGGAGARIRHGDTTDLVLLSPGKPTTARDASSNLDAEVGYVSVSRASTRMALVKGASASAQGWTLRSSGSVALTVVGREASGETNGEAQEVRITPPSTISRQAVKITLDGKPMGLRTVGDAIALTPGAGRHTFRLSW